MNRIAVHVEAGDPVSRAGIVSQLRPRPEIEVRDATTPLDARVAIVVVDTVDEAAAQTLRRLQRANCRLVLVSTELGNAGLAAAAELGVGALIRRSEATADRLTHAVCAVDRGDGAIPEDLLGKLMEQVSQLHQQVLQPRGLSLHGLANREIDVLRLVADGYDTAEIAKQLAYSERTVKNVLHDVTTRLQLRNRSQAVAYALRQGVI